MRTNFFVVKTVGLSRKCKYFPKQQFHISNRDKSRNTKDFSEYEY